MFRFFSQLTKTTFLTPNAIWQLSKLGSNLKYRLLYSKQCHLATHLATQTKLSSIYSTIYRAWAAHYCIVHYLNVSVIQMSGIWITTVLLYMRANCTGGNCGSRSISWEPLGYIIKLYNCIERNVVKYNYFLWLSNFKTLPINEFNNNVE